MDAEREDGCWSAWFNGLSEALRNVSTGSPPPRYHGPAEPVDELQTEGVVAPLHYQPTGQLWSDERPEASRS
jgi:hypothetical protein